MELRTQGEEQQEMSLRVRRGVGGSQLCLVGHNDNDYLNFILSVNESHWRFKVGFHLLSTYHLLSPTPCQTLD